jgi:hypothetical protein
MAATIDGSWESPRAGTDVAPGVSDAVTFSFGDPQANVFGIARAGLATGADGAVTSSGLVLLFVDGEPVAVRADGGVEIDAPSWEAVDVAGLRTTIAEPLRAWTVAFGDEQGDARFELRFEATAAPAVVDDSQPAARVGGMAGYESLCRVTGTVVAGGTTRTIDGLGQRGHSWGAPDWESLSLARTLSVWMAPDLGVTLTAVRQQRAKAHDAEAVTAFLVEPEEEGVGAVVPHLVEDPLFSTRYDGDGRQLAAGLELYVTEDGYARRAAGEVVCGTTLDLGRLRLDCAFFRWRMEGREGIGRYDILRRV